MSDFERLLKVLGAAKVKFVIIGGVAIVAHGSSYMTNDLDICYERSPENLSRLASALQSHRPKLRDVPESIPFELDTRALTLGMNFTLKTDLGAIDLMGEVLGVGQYEELASTAVSIELDGEMCKVASLESLITAKRATNRPKDRLILPELEALQELQTAAKNKSSNPK